MAKRRWATKKPVYTGQQTFHAYLVTGWFAFGVYLLYQVVTSPTGENVLLDLFHLMVISCVMVFLFPLAAAVLNTINGVAALQKQDYTQSLLSFGLAVGILLAWYLIRYALYGRENARMNAAHTP